MEKEKAQIRRKLVNAHTTCDVVLDGGEAVTERKGQLAGDGRVDRHIIVFYREGLVVALPLLAYVAQRVFGGVANRSDAIPAAQYLF